MKILTPFIGLTIKNASVAFDDYSNLIFVIEFTNGSKIEIVPDCDDMGGAASIYGHFGPGDPLYYSLHTDMSENIDVLCSITNMLSPDELKWLKENDRRVVAGQDKPGHVSWISSAPETLQRFDPQIIAMTSPAPDVCEGCDEIVANDIRQLAAAHSKE